ncbi:MAG TPA: NUDIX hydrolase [Candidatus Paceibacterota bacterium]|nr:NUDIX hydrolase [Candidatus Paceibacterota bacterium]HPT18268.1 NUDIX hydrolase [Candidatus Paceibacterota bacterium]
MEDENLLEFGIKRENEERRDGGCAVVFDPESQKYAVYINTKNGIYGLFGGGFNEGEDEKEGVLRELREESGLYDFLYIEKIDKVLTHYFNSNKEVNRVATAVCFLVILKSSDRKDPKLEEHEKFEFIFTEPKEIMNNWQSRNQNKDYDHWIYFLKKGTERAGKLGYDKKITE